MDRRLGVFHPLGLAGPPPTPPSQALINHDPLGVPSVLERTYNWGRETAVLVSAAPRKHFSLSAEKALSAAVGAFSLLCHLKNGEIRYISVWV